MKKLLLTALLFTSIILGCKKNSSDQLTNSEKDGLTAKQDSLFSLLKDTTFSPKDMILPDGGSVGDFLLYYDSAFYHQWNRVAQITTDIEVQKALFISKITNIANHMVIKTNYVYPDEGALKPAQTGLAYVWGGRAFEQRKLNANCTDNLYGVDCSGMLIRILRYAGLNVIDGTANSLREVSYLNGLFSQSNEYNNLTYEDKGTSVAITQLQTGDIIYFKIGTVAKHIGIALKDINGKLWIYQSNGTNETPNCSNNINKGPRCIAIETFSLTDWGFTSYGVLRIPSPLSSAIVDVDGNVYHSITIGGQQWLLENLKTSRYRNGDPIPTGLSDAQWGTTTTGAFSVYNNTPANNITYGKLYNWYAVADPRKIAPAGWHVPSDAEWDILINYLGGTNVAGGKLKAVSPLWNSPNTGATNSSGFTGLPGGGRDDGRLFGGIVQYLGLGGYGYWWTMSENNNPTATAWNHSAYNTLNSSFTAYDSKGFGFSVRCIKD